MDQDKPYPFKSPPYGGGLGEAGSTQPVSPLPRGHGAS